MSGLLLSTKYSNTKMDGIDAFFMTVLELRPKENQANIEHKTNVTSPHAGTFGAV